jgi:HEAT repeats
MLTNEAEFEVLLARYDDDPGICSKILRTHSLTDPQIFLGYAQNAILNRPVTRALKFITGLALSAGLMDQLLDLYVKARPRCMELAQKLIACDPRFDLTFLEFLQRPRSGNTNEENLFHIGLDILDLVSQGDRLVPGVLKILKHPNPKVRSKAALFIGSRTQNLAWASRTQEYDARVRANILESLFGINSDFVHQIFRNNVADENNRVSGNAILGLYLLGDTSSIPLILDLSRHPDARFRNTCAWIMGRTGDPRFAQSFSELMNDPDELVRAQAFKGLGEIRKSLRAKASRPELRAGIAKVNPEEPSLVTTVCNAAGQPVQGIPSTAFILRSGTPARPVRHFTVTEYDCRSPLNVAFVLCLPEQGEAAAEAHFLQAIAGCDVLRRSKDRWAILKISAKLNRTQVRTDMAPKSDAIHRQRQKWSILHVDFDPASSAAAPVHTAQEPHGFDYSNAQPRIEAMLRDLPAMIGPGATDDSARVVVNSLLRGDTASGNPHLIFLGAGPEPHLVEPLHARGPEIPAVVHILAQSDVWRGETCRDLSAKTGGIHRNVDSYSSLSDACFDTYSSLLHHYRINWKDAGTDNLDLDIHFETGRASVSYEATPPAVVPDAISA